MITISKPEVVKRGDVSRLQADIQIEGSESHTLFFEVNNEHAHFLTADRADAFVVALIPLIAKFGGGV